MARFFLSMLRSGSVPLFLLLEVVCLSLIVRFNSEQHAIAKYSLGRVQGKLNKWRTELSLQLSLQNRLDSMAAVQARLLESYLSANDSRLLLSVDSLSWQRDSFRLVSALIINNSISHRNNYMTLDKGRLDGLREGMGVLVPEGPVGIVIKVSEHYALVMSLLHQQARLSAKLQNQGYFGSLVWKDLRNPRKMYLEDIPRHARVALGDTVETSGYSDIFPAGMPLGRVDTFWVSPASDFYEIEVSLWPDIAALRYVYVVEKLGTQEKQSLEESVKHE